MQEVPGPCCCEREGSPGGPGLLEADEGARRLAPRRSRPNPTRRRLLEAGSPSPRDRCPEAERLRRAKRQKAEIELERRKAARLREID